MKSYYDNARPVHHACPGRGSIGIIPRSAVVLAIVLVCLIAGPASAGQERQAPKVVHEAHAATAEDAGSKAYMNVKVELQDLELLTQDGEAVRFKSDVIGDKLVAVTFIYTYCTTVCPIYNAIFSQLQELLGERQGKDVILISMSLDPARDIPLRMKREAKKFGAKPGWPYLTGKKQNVDRVLRGLDAYFPDFTEHPPMALIGDGKTGTWKRFNGFPMPEQLLAMIDALKAARQ